MVTTMVNSGRGLFPPIGLDHRRGRDHDGVAVVDREDLDLLDCKTPLECAAEHIDRSRMAPAIDAPERSAPQSWDIESVDEHELLASDTRKLENKPIKLDIR
jgi:hypothetical protein